MIVRLLEEAEDDLESITAYIARDDRRRAISFAAELSAKVLGLSTMAESFPLARIPWHPDLRRRTYRGYGIYYSVNAASGTVDVHRILHSARDIEAIFRR